MGFHREVYWGFVGVVGLGLLIGLGFRASQGGDLKGSCGLRLVFCGGEGGGGGGGGGVRHFLTVSFCGERNYEPQFWRRVWVDKAGAVHQPARNSETPGSLQLCNTSPLGFRV